MLLYRTGGQMFLLFFFSPILPIIFFRSKFPSRFVVFYINISNETKNKGEKNTYEIGERFSLNINCEDTQNGIAINQTVFTLLKASISLTIVRFFLLFIYKTLILIRFSFIIIVRVTTYEQKINK